MDLDKWLRVSLYRRSGIKEKIEVKLYKDVVVGWLLL